MNEEEVSIPFSTDWSEEEIVKVVHFFTLVDRAYGEGVRAGELLNAYNQFKKVVPAKDEEKTYFRDYDKRAGQLCWRTVQMARKAEDPDTVVRHT
ncbi:UPF0223 family protein [Natribacillus halophilus]|uniref:Uncharacterized protein YktA, UPF0223 family n=1 Tax=Natribacillus halophilus TaxID=549003 RepID=A0A1G8MBF3_9BACI|nr:UPF0223 family protein [Natribacillus halophilus]SDI65274.1 Uncharacterized protein YktA, UPF0223 family [Natribacillus halophilus]